MTITSISWGQVPSWVRVSPRLPCSRAHSLVKEKDRKTKIGNSNIMWLIYDRDDWGAGGSEEREAPQSDLLRADFFCEKIKTKWQPWINASPAPNTVHFFSFTIELAPTVRMKPGNKMKAETQAHIPLQQFKARHKSKTEGVLNPFL